MNCQPSLDNSPDNVHHDRIKNNQKQLFHQSDIESLTWATCMLLSFLVQNYMLSINQYYSIYICLGAKTRSFQPYQCHMARTSPSALMEHLLPKLTELYRGRPAIYQQVDDMENNNYSYNNNNHTENNREVGIFNSGHPGLKVWQMITKNIMGINCLYSHAQRKQVFPIDTSSHIQYLKKIADFQFPKLIRLIIFNAFLFLQRKFPGRLKLRQYHKQNKQNSITFLHCSTSIVYLVNSMQFNLNSQQTE